MGFGLLVWRLPAARLRLRRFCRFEARQAAFLVVSAASLGSGAIGRRLANAVADLGPDNPGPLTAQTLDRPQGGAKGSNPLRQDWRGHVRKGQS